MQKLTPFVIKKIEGKLKCIISEKGACAELRRNLTNTDSEDGRFALNTIKRWFGIVEKQVEPQQNGLEAIAEYLGYPSWVALTLEPEYNQTKVKTEEDYISEIFPEYTNLLQGIRDYQFKKEQTKNRDEVFQYQNRIDDLKKRQNTLKDAIVQLSNLLTDPTPFQSDFDKISMLFENGQFNEANQLLDENRLKEEQEVLLRSLKKKDHDVDIIQKQLYQNAYCFCIKGEICESFNQFEEEEKYYLLSLKSKRVFDTLLKLGQFYFRQKKDNELSLLFLEEIENKRDEIFEYNELNFFCDRPHNALLYLESLFYKGQVYFNQKNYEEGHRVMDLLSGAYSVVYENDKSKQEMLLKIAHIYNERGIAVFEENDYENAHVFYSKALDIYKQYNNDYNFFETTINLAINYNKKNQFEFGKKELTSALNYFSSKFRNEDDIEFKQKYRFRVGKCHYAFGRMYQMQNNHGEAEKSFKRALITYEKLNEITPKLLAKLEIMDTFKALGHVYKEMGNTEKVDEYLQKTYLFVEANPDVSDYVLQYMFGAFQEKTKDNA